MRMTASYWKQITDTEHKYIIQILIPKSVKRLTELKKIFKSWHITGRGIDPRQDAKIILFSKSFHSPDGWDLFRRDSMLDKILQIKEVE